MKLIIGLGNPEKKYSLTRHNAGWLAIDQLQGELAFPTFKFAKKFQAETTAGNFEKERIILAKPQTYMNNSGLTVRSLKNFYKIKLSDVWVIHDDIDLPVGKIRISQGASAGGHKGIISIIENLGAKDFVRFRIGVLGKDKGKIPTETYVLQKFKPAEEKNIQTSIKETATAIKLALVKNLEQAMNEYN